MTDPIYTRAPLDLVTDERLSDLAVRVYLVLAARIGRRRSWTGSQNDIADELGISRRHLQRALRALLAAGYITSTASAGGSSTYATCDVPTYDSPDAPPTTPVAQPYDSAVVPPTTPVSYPQPVVPTLPEQNTDQTRSDQSESGSDTGAREEQDSEVGDDPIRMPGMPPAGYDELRQMSGLPVRRLLDAIRDELDASHVSRRDAEEMRDLAQHLNAEDCDEIRRLSDGKPWKFAHAVIGRAAADRRRGRDPWADRGGNGADRRNRRGHDRGRGTPGDESGGLGTEASIATAQRLLDETRARTGAARTREANHAGDGT